MWTEQLLQIAIFTVFGLLGTVCSPVPSTSLDTTVIPTTTSNYKDNNETNSSNESYISEEGPVFFSEGDVDVTILDLGGILKVDESNNTADERNISISRILSLLRRDIAQVSSKDDSFHNGDHYADYSSQSPNKKDDIRHSMTATPNFHTSMVKEKQPINYPESSFFVTGIGSELSSTTTDKPFDSSFSQSSSSKKEKGSSIDNSYSDSLIKKNELSSWPTSANVPAGMSKNYETIKQRSVGEEQSNFFVIGSELSTATMPTSLASIIASNNDQTKKEKRNINDEPEPKFGTFESHISTSSELVTTNKLNLPTTDQTSSTPFDEKHSTDVFITTESPYSDSSTKNYYTTTDSGSKSFFERFFSLETQVE